MTEHEILSSIARNLSERKRTTALNNYEVLGNNIKYVNELLKHAIVEFAVIQSSAVECFKNPAVLNEAFKESNVLAPFTKIVPRIIANGLAILEKFALNTEPDDRSDVSLDSLNKLQRGFMEYNNLVTAARQIVDSLVSDGYQLYLLDSKSANYHVLVSLNSFDKFVTASIRDALFTKEIVDALAEFRKLDYKKWASSHITKCAQPTFANKVDFLFEQIGLSSENSFKDEIKDLFKFSSEFTHIGYVSTFFTSSLESEVILGDDIGPYLPSAENFSELKYKILETVTSLFAKLYIPVLASMIGKIITQDTAKDYLLRLSNLASKMQEQIKTRNNKYYFFIKSGLIGSDKIIDLKCQCGTTKSWKTPHDLNSLYCATCGSHFNLLEVEGESGYIITSAGPIKVIGSDVPDFHKLPIEEQNRMMKEAKALIAKKDDKS